MCKDFYFGCQPSTSLQNRDSQPEKEGEKQSVESDETREETIRDAQYANELKKKTNISDTACIDGELVESIMCNIPNISNRNILRTLTILRRKLPKNTSKPI
jgi:hypothetical protein